MTNLAEEIIKMTKKMRTAAYQFGSIQEEKDVIPFGGSIRESIGPFPEFILKGRFCTRSLRGYCTPCFYSRLPEHTIKDHQFDVGYDLQVQYIVDNFENKVISNQVGKVAYPKIHENPIYGMVCTPTGSYFDSKEYPVEVRKANLVKLYETAKQYRCEIALHIESHAEDVLNYFKAPDTEEIRLLRSLNTRVLLGFESSNNFSRNVLYAKQLPLEIFERAVSTLRKYSFPVGAFIFAGLFAYTDEETIFDVTESLLYLKQRNVSPVLMFSNTQKYTIPDVLLENGRFKLLDPRTVASIIDITTTILGCDMYGDIDPWFIADPKGGPPDPNVHIFNAPTSKTCPTCANKIYAAIENLRITKDIEPFKKMLNEIGNCSCTVDYLKINQMQLEQIQKRNIVERTTELVALADNLFEYYVLKENPWKIKAELLCYGLYLSEEQKNVIRDFNPFICEKGFVNATHIKFCGILINVCVAENFCQRSPYSAQQDTLGNWILLKNGHELGNFKFLRFPEWVTKPYGNRLAGEIARPHSDKCISIWPSLSCTYVKQGEGCRYCSLNALSDDHMTVLDAVTVAGVVKLALSSGIQYEVNLSGGTCGSPDYALEYLSGICREIVKQCGKVPISIECAPPSNIESLQLLKDSGATAVVMNLEVFDEHIRRTICPGKGNISNEGYFRALQKCVQLFGSGNVSSVLIVGIQPKEDILSACNKLIDIGVIPTLIPFKPIDDTPMEGHDLTDCMEYVSISRTVSHKLKQKHLAIDKSSGCAACGACSLESNLEEMI